MTNGCKSQSGRYCLYSPKRESYFCTNCNVPLLNKVCEVCGNVATTKIPSKISPVFKEELQMLAEVTGEPVDVFESLDLWATERYYYYKGQKIFKIVGGNLVESPKIVWIKNKDRIIREIKKREEISRSEYIKRIEDANYFAISSLEGKALRFIKTVAEGFEHSRIAVSFSGGKDSAVVSRLVRKALGDNGILHIFADTTLENPDTLEYIKLFCEEEKIFLIKIEPQDNFISLVKKAMLPSRVHRWCCTVLKTSPIESLIRQILDSNKKMLVFEGIRKEESKKRERYEEIDTTTKIASQIAVRPILYWSTLEVWLYTLINNIPINQSYLKGMRRVGCSLCPLAREYSEFLMEYWSKKDKRYNMIWRPLTELLLNEIRQIKKNVYNLDEYLAEGKWKGRVGSFGRNNIKIESNSDWVDKISLNIEIDEERLKNYLIPIGIMHSYSNSILLVDKDNKLLCKIKPNGTKLDIFISDNIIKNQILKQIVKALHCINCGVCANLCPNRAISNNGQGYIIDNNKCRRCKNCVNVSEKGCLIAESLRVKFVNEGDVS